MPIFEYKCNACGSLFEKLVVRDTGEAHTCPNCNSNDTEKKLSVFGGIVMGNSNAVNCTSAPGCGLAGTGCGGCCGH